MMDISSFKKRISDTQVDIYPLDRLLPLNSVYSIFVEEYKKSSDKELFFKDRYYQRLREGYFALFAAISLQDTSKEEHFLLFPSVADNDVYICHRDEKSENERLIAFAFDIKEFTDWSKDFEKFIDEKVLPKIDIYNMAISTYRKIEGKDIQLLVDYLENNNSTSKIWFVGSPTEEDSGYQTSKVSIFSKDGLLYDKVLNLDDWLDSAGPVEIFQDVIRLK